MGDTRTTTTEPTSTTEPPAPHSALIGICKTRASTDPSSPTTTTTTPTIPTHVTGATTVTAKTTMLFQMLASAASCTPHSTCTLLWTSQSNSEVPTSQI